MAAVSAMALQRVVVRMMYDPAFCKRVYANPERALHDVPLTPQERQWLVTPKPSAYGADAYRSHRALTGLLEEFPVAGALAVRLPRGIQRLQQFFATRAFHQCVQARGSMAAAFGAYLGSEVFRSRNMPSEIAHMATVETAIAYVRRVSPTPLPPTESITTETPFGLAPWVVLLTAHPAVSARYHRLLASLQQHGGSLLEAALDTPYRLPPGSAFRGKATTLILVSHIPDSDGPTLEGMTDDLGKLLTAAKTPMRLSDLSALAEAMGCEPEEASDAVAELVDARILNPHPHPAVS